VTNRGEKPDRSSAPKGAPAGFSIGSALVRSNPQRFDSGIKGSGFWIFLGTINSNKKLKLHQVEKFSAPSGAEIGSQRRSKNPQNQVT